MPCPEESCVTQGRDVDIDDPLLLGVQGVRHNHASRLAAAMALGLVAPWAVLLGGGATRCARRLGRVVDGTANWVGVRDEVDPDAVALDVLRLLVPPDARDEERTAARALYARNKSAGLDIKLLVGWAHRCQRELVVNPLRASPSDSAAATWGTSGIGVFAERRDPGFSSASRPRART